MSKQVTIENRIINSGLMAHNDDTHFRLAFDSAPTGMCLVGLDGRFLRVNAAFREMMGYSADELRSLTFRDITHPDDVAVSVEWVGQLLAGHSVSPTLDKRYIHKNGRAVWGMVCASLLRGDDGEPRYFVTHVQDITQRKQAEAAARESEQFVRSILDSLPAHICVVDAAGVIVATNRAWREFAEANPPMPRQAMEGANYLAVCETAVGDGAQEAAAFVAGWRAVVAGEQESFGLEYACHSPDEQRWFACHLTRLRGDGPLRLVVAHENITERKQAAEALRQSEERLTRAAASSNTGLWDWDLRTNKVYFSPIWKQQIGYEDHEIPNCFEEWQSRVHPDDLQRTLARVRAFAAKPWPDYENEFRFRHKDGSYRWILAKASVILDDTGKPCRMTGSHLDITERKGAETALRDSQHFVEKILAATPLLIYIYDMAEHRNVFANRSVAERLGYSAAQIQAMGSALFPTILHPDDAAEVARHHARLAAARDEDVLELEYRMKHADGGWRWLRSRDIAFARDEQGAGRQILGAAEDVTVRKREEHSLRESEDRFRSLVESAPDAIFVQSEGRFVYVNTAMLRLVGASKPQELLGMDFMERMAPEFRDAIRQRVRIQIETGKPVPPMEQEYLRLDGSRVPVETTAVPIQFQGSDAHLVFVRDISEQKRIELAAREQQVQLAHLSRVASVGELASGLAHELNQPLGSILNYATLCADLLQRGDCQPDLTHQALRGLADEAQRASEILRRMRTFIGKQESHRNPKDIVPIVREAIRLMAFELRTAAIHPVEQFAENLPMVYVDAVQVEQVLVNLIQNAIDAMAQTPPARRRLVVRISPTEARAVQVEVEDAGRGVAPELKARLFKPFVTTKPDGLGLGLSISRSIVERHGGRLDMQPNAAGGTTFSFTLPIAER